MSVKHPNSDDMEKTVSQHSSNDSTIEVEDDILEQTDKRQAIVLPKEGPSTPPPKEKDVVSPPPKEENVVSSNTLDQHNGHKQSHQNSQTSDAEKPILV